MITNGIVIKTDTGWRGFTLSKLNGSYSVLRPTEQNCLSSVADMLLSICITDVLSGKYMNIARA